MVPICLISLIGFIAASWGSQFYMICIEALIISFLLVIVTIVEFKTAVLYGYNKIVDNEESFANAFSIPDLEDKDEIDRKLRRDALRGIINRIKGDVDIYNTNKVEECIKNQRDYIHDRYSLPDQYRYKEDEDESDESQHPYSYPITPKTRAKLDYPIMFPLPEVIKTIDDEFPDNVYADSKPPNPLKGKNKAITTVRTTQTFAKETMHGDPFSINEDFFGADTHASKKVKHRKRRNAYYNQVEDEDEDGFNEMDEKENKLGVIYEEDEHGRKVRKSVYYESDSEYEDSSKVPIHHPPPRNHAFNEH